MGWKLAYYKILIPWALLQAGAI